MKLHYYYFRYAILLFLLCWVISPAICPGQTVFGQPAAESPPDTAAKPQDAAAPANPPVASTSETLPKTVPGTTAGSDTLTDFLSKLPLKTLWNNYSILDWAILLGYIFAGMVLGKIVSILLLRISSGKEGVISKIFSDMAGPANLAIVTLGIFAGLYWMKLESTLGTFLLNTIKLMLTIAVFWYLYNVIGLIDPLLHRLSRNSASALDKQVAPLVRRTLRVFLIIITVMYIFKDIFGADIGAWLAGLGIAGIAVSLAAQDSLKNLFGSITIILDRPFKIGERIICTGYEGVIEDIGFRSTKVRTPAGHLVSIPNANVVNSPIENISRRPGIRRSFNINLASDTPAEKIKRAAAIVRELIEDKEFREPIHQHINGDAVAPQVVCGDFANNCTTLSVAYWFNTTKSAEFAKHSERLNLRILEEFEKAGIRLAAAK